MSDQLGSDRLGGAGQDQLGDLEGLSTEELRQRAFALARQRRDVGFLWDLFTHVPHAREELHDGWIGSLTANVEDVIALWREATAHRYGEAEPLVRAKFIDYLGKG